MSIFYAACFRLLKLGDGLTIDMYWMFVAVSVATRDLGPVTLLYMAPRVGIHGDDETGTL